MRSALAQALYSYEHKIHWKNLIFAPSISAIVTSFAFTLVLSLSILTPYSFIHFSLSKMLIGGAIAFWLALAGEKLGERAAGNRFPKD